MKKLLLGLSFLFCFQIVSSAQYGISIAYKPISAPNWETIIAEHKIYEPSSFEITPLSQGIHFGVDYWFRLKKHRVEFVPELSIARFTRMWEKETINDQITSNFFGFHVNTNFYVFDLKGDCDCPTFSKDGTLISKGFHFIVNTGLIRHNVETSIDDPSTDPALSFDVESYTFRGGIGVGLDIGLTELITLSPHILVSRNFGVNAINFTDFTPADTISSSSLNQLNIGLRLIFRPDYQKPNFGYR